MTGTGGLLLFVVWMITVVMLYQSAGCSAATPC